MNIIVCVKQVPDTAEIAIDWEKHTLIREGVSSILNPFDGYALEAAAKIKDENPDTKIYVLSMGPKQAESMLRECLAIAADQAYLLTDHKFGGADTFATSYALSQAIRYIEEVEHITFQGIFCGKQAIDGDTAQVGPEIAEHMGYPQATCCLRAEENNKEFKVIREGDDERQVMGIIYPCVLTFTKPELDPRFPTFKRRIEAKKKNITLITASDIKTLDNSYIGICGSPTKVKKSFVQKSKKQGMIVEVDDVEKGAKEICEILKPYICNGGIV